MRLDGIEGTAKFERSSFLHGLDLEKVFFASGWNDCFRCQNGCSMSDTLDSRCSILDIVKLDAIFLFRHDGECND